MKPSQLTPMLEMCWNTNSPLMIWGPPGIGKSQIIAQYAEAIGVPMIEIRLSQIDSTDLSGVPWIENGQTIWARPDRLPLLERDGPAGILFLDEITSAMPQVSASAYQLVLDRAVGSHKLPDGWRVIAAGNRQQDRGVTHAMPAPLANRFTHSFLEPDLDDLRAYAIRTGWDVRVPAFLAFRPELMFSFDARSADPAFPTPRAYDRLSQKLLAGIPDAIRWETVRGEIGEGASVEFLAFLDMADKCTPPDVILLDPDKAKLPADAGIAFATVGALASKTTKANLGTALRYMNRVEDKLGAEFGVLFMRDVTTANPDIHTTQAFIAWASAHAEVIL